MTNTIANFAGSGAALTSIGTHTRPALSFPNDRATLTVVVPTYRERANIRPLVALLEIALAGQDWSVLFVDDDSDCKIACNNDPLGGDFRVQS